MLPRSRRRPLDRSAGPSPDLPKYPGAAEVYLTNWASWKTNMVSIVSTIAYLGLEARRVEVQCQVAPVMVGFAVVGLPEKAVADLLALLNYLKGQALSFASPAELA